MKKNAVAILALTAALCLTACTGTPATKPPSGDTDTSPQSNVGAEEKPVRTGLSMQTSTAKSKGAESGEQGSAQVEISLVAVTVDDDGMITDCVIDGIQTTVAFDAAGQLMSDPGAPVSSKNELGEAYGMKQASAIGREWSEQAAAMAAYAVGKTVEEIRGIAVDEQGRTIVADLAASVTISITDMVSGIESAVSGAQHIGAKSGDRLALTTVANTSKSKSAVGTEDGLAQTDVSAAAITLRGDAITSCCIDGVQAQVAFDSRGELTSDPETELPTKNQLGDSYGMKQASSIGREWYEQAASFCTYVTGKTAKEVSSIAVNEATKPANADLAASVTIGIGDFQALIAKAAG